MLKSRIPLITIEIQGLVEAAIEAGAQLIAEDAKARAPVATGKLRTAIHVDRESDGVHVTAGDTDAWYGHLVEHGTTHSPPKPFLVPALEARRDDVVDGVKRALKGL